MAKNRTTYELLLELAAKMDPSYRTSLENAGRGIEDVGDSAREASDSIGVMDIAIGNLIADGISGLITAAGAAVRSLQDLPEETREFRQDMATLETAFDSAGFSAEKATETWKDLYSVFGEDDRAVEAANNIARMANNQRDLDKWVKITTGIWGTYQDALPVEGLAEAAGETAKVGKVTGVMADALNWSSEAAALLADYMDEDVTNAEDAFNVALSECSDEAERQALITDMLSTLYGDAADKYRETAGSIMEANDAQAEYLLTQAEMAEKVEPAMTAIKTGVTDLKKEIYGLVGEVDFEQMAARIESGFDWTINTALPWLIYMAIPWLRTNLPTIGVAIAGIGSAILAVNFVSIITGIKTSFLALNAVMAANPVGLIIIGITALVAAFVYLWTNCEWFRNFWIGMWEGIKNAAAAVADWFTGTLIPAVIYAWGILSNTAITWYNNVLLPIIEGVKRIFGGLIEFITGVFTGDWSMAWQGVVDIFGGIFDTIIGLVAAPFRSVITIINSVLDHINGMNITIPDWVPVLGGKNFSLNIPQIPMLANGGIVTDPTLAMIGEGNEDEAVIPLSKLGDLMGGSETTSIVYSPTITVMPGASAEDVKAATAESFEQFKAFMERYMRERKRLSFA